MKSRRVILRCIPSSRSRESRTISPRLRLRAALGLLHCQFRALESDAAVGSVAEGLIDRPAATAERKCGLAGEVEMVAVDVHQFDSALGSFDAERAIGPNGDLHLSHESNPPTLLISSRHKKIPRPRRVVHYAHYAAAARTESRSR